MPVVRQLGVQDYRTVWQAMRDFTERRDGDSCDEIWIVEHPPVLTLGLNGKAEHLLQATDIPLVETDRGGQITYHGPGQLIVYCLVDCRRLQKGPRQMVTMLENAMIVTLVQYGIVAHARPEAPGVYVEQSKIGSIGLRIKKGCSYHGLSLNNRMDLGPFALINPCGYPGMRVTQLADLGIAVETHELAVPVVHHLIKAMQT